VLYLSYAPVYYHIYSNCGGERRIRYSANAYLTVSALEGARYDDD